MHTIVKIRRAAPGRRENLFTCQIGKMDEEEQVKLSLHMNH